MANASVGIATDQFTIDKNNTNYRFTGSFIVNHLHSNKTIYQYGATVTCLYGTPLLFPILGIRTKIAKNWTFSTILPAEISFINKINTQTGLIFSLRPSENRFQFDNQGNVNTNLSSLFLQVRQFQLGTAVFYKLSKSFMLNGDVGFLVGGKFQFTEQETPSNILYKTTLNAGTVFRLSLRYRIPRKKEIGENKLQDILNPLCN